ncbi:ATP12-domain-containing protein [Punctularia strigosozonata HHB-11173 SS5]|uniref:ATP12-domain-containing protein n=1 Tax=Punctularia strigosozonata (strain HHB-11173) TaxID=741275 RepID=UPI00044167D7|nr:ATP12-domain-containing protein [Punctularia strigosozonata HHB-11173 SS5]EIN07833.1 ATP12-domain-containing protein [Punctularia strigosozonata HHB-11173 SS5]
MHNLRRAVGPALARRITPGFRIQSWCLRRCQATAATDGPAITATNKAEASLKRFWKTVGVEEKDGTYAVTLDQRTLRTPGGNRLLLPKEKKLVAALVATEWDNQETLLKPHALPMTSLASRAVDAFKDPETRKQVRSSLLKYFETDTICFHETEPPALVELQKKHWHPILDWARSTFGVEIHAFDSLLAGPQPPETVQKFDEIMQSLDAWELAALERTTYVTKSFLIALALVKRQITAEEAALASHVEVNSQIQRWGEVEDSHDVDYHDVRRHLGSASVLLSAV